MGPAQYRTGNALVIVQITLSAVLLCGAALFLRSLWNLTAQDAGFQHDGILTMRIDATLPRRNLPQDGKAAEDEHARLARMSHGRSAADGLINARRPQTHAPSTATTASTARRLRVTA